MPPTISETVGIAELFAALDAPLFAFAPVPPLLEPPQAATPTASAATAAAATAFCVLVAGMDVLPFEGSMMRRRVRCRRGRCAGSGARRAVDVRADRSGLRRSM